MTQQAHKLTPLAILAVFVLTIPGCVIGQIVSFLYVHFLMGYLEGNLFDWISGGWFKILMMAIIPNALSGAIGGFFGLRITFAIKPLRQANYEIAAYAISAIVVVLGALGILMIFTRDGISVRLIESLSNGVGIVAGLFSAHQSVQEDQNRVMAA